MRYSASEKAEIIMLVEQSNLPIRQTLQRLDITKSTFYNWLKRFEDVMVCMIENRGPVRSGINCLRASVTPLSNWH